jgi:hypothetical protein
MSERTVEDRLREEYFVLLPTRDGFLRNWKLKFGTVFCRYRRSWTGMNG